MLLKLVFQVSKNPARFKTKNVVIPNGATNIHLNKVRTGNFAEIQYTPKNAKILARIGKRTIKDFKSKTVRLPNSNSPFFARSVKLKRGTQTLSVGR